MTGLHLLGLPADRISAEVVAVFFFEDERPLTGPAGLVDWRLNGLLTGLLLEGRAIGRAGENILVRANGKLQASWVLFAGGGKRGELGTGTLERLLRNLLKTCRLAGLERLSLCLAPLAGVETGTVEQVALRALEDSGDDAFECWIAIQNDEKP